MAWEHAFSTQMFDLALSEEDVEELRSERTIKHTLVTAEEIEELTVDECLSPFDRLIYVLRTGRDIQKVHAINHMYKIVANETRENMEKAFVLLKQTLNNNNASKDIQLAGAKLLLEVSENRLINGERFASHFSNDVFTNVKNSKDAEISDGWIDALIGSLSLIPKRYLNEIVEFLKTSGKLTQTMQVRLLCCKLIAHVSKYIDKTRLTKDMLPVMRSLCQDIDLDVRACMCHQLTVVLTYIGDDVVNDFLLPELSLLLEDEETIVRLACLETLAKILHTVTPALIETSSLRKLTVRFYEKSVEKKILQEVIGSARFIGQIVSSPGFLDDEQKAMLVVFYKDLCNQGLTAESSQKYENSLAVLGCNSMSDESAECRYWCAYNFPAVVVSASAEQIVSILIPCFLQLIKDVHPVVRKPLAYSFHEVSKLFAGEMDTVYKALVILLQDKDMEIVDGVLSTLPMVLDVLYGSTSFQNYVLTLLPTLLACEVYLSDSLRWRVHEKFLTTLLCLSKFLPSDEIHVKLVPLLFTILSSSKVQPVKLAAGHTLLSFIKASHNVDERNEMSCRLETELAHSPSKACRLLYLDLCSHVAELFSRNFFKEKFYNAAMELATDPVVNVRLSFCETLPLLKSQIHLPCDRLLLQTLEQTVRRIMAMENDRDVANAIRKAITEMDSVRLSMDGTAPTEEDLIDREKEEEEETILQEHTQRRTEKECKLPPRGGERNRSGSLTDYKTENIGRRSLTSESVDKIRERGPGKVSSKGSLTKITRKTRATKEGQCSKVPGKSGSGAKLKRSSGGSGDKVEKNKR